MKKLIIPGTLRNLNDLIAAERTNRYLAAKMKKEDETTVLWAAKGCLRGWKASGPVVMHYKWYEKNQRRDKDNISSYGRKIIQDALVKGGYLENDGWENIIGFDDEFYVDKKLPRIEVWIEEGKET